MEPREWMPRSRRSDIEAPPAQAGDFGRRNFVAVLAAFWSSNPPVSPRIAGGDDDGPEITGEYGGRARCGGPFAISGVHLQEFECCQSPSPGWPVSLPL